jgi:hypothetical protein
VIVSPACAASSVFVSWAVCLCMLGYVFVMIENHFGFCHGLLVGFGADLVVVNS